jgi:enoyl-CoA hydratase/carnithine racemase
MTGDVRFERRGRAGLISLNRPAALNALNRGMCVAIHRQLDQWAADDGVSVVIVQGEGEKAFCAGGDVVGLYHAGKAGSPDWENFFADEYRMNLRIGQYAKPYVALIDGVTMGGGVGLSVHAPFRIATERTVFAMPETGIGLIPDVGGTHALPRLPGELGAYLGLTGARLKAADCLYAGIATHHMPSSVLASVVDALIDGGAADAVLAGAHVDPGPPPLAEARAIIDKHFAHDTVEAIMASLSMGDDWAVAQRDTLMKMSPTSMKLTLRALRAGRMDDLAGCLCREYRIVSAIKSGHDFFEGVRAQLVDKDRNPRWRPAALRDVTDEIVDAHFAAPAWGDLTL